MQLDSPLISTETLANALDDPSLRIFDTTIYLRHKPDGGGYLPESGRDDFDAQHIPGAGFIDVLKDISDSKQAVPFMMPPADEFAATMAAFGVSSNSAVVLYNNGVPMWSTRVWWMLRSIGFENVAVLDGGFEKWLSENRPVSKDPCEYAPGQLSAAARPQMWADKTTMLDVVNGSGVVTLNALSPEVYAGDKNQYGRPGHLPNTHNVFYGSLLNENDGTFRPAAELATLFKDSGALEADQVITYCGGGISATMDCLALNLCGQDNIAVYDGSMSEWVKDDSLPLKLGAEP